nr:uncharacterized protein LOC115494968 isoform X2 [Taeniopygia guttata]
MKRAHPASSSGEAPPGSEAPSLCAAGRCRARCGWRRLRALPTGRVWRGDRNAARSKRAGGGGRPGLPAPPRPARRSCRLPQGKPGWAPQSWACSGETGVCSAPALGIPRTPRVKGREWKRGNIRTSCRLGRWTVPEEDLGSCSPASLLAWWREKYATRWHETRWIWISSQSR